MSITEDRKSEIADEMDAEIKYREDGYLDDERARREDLNQGMNTGTHGYAHRGVKWPPSYRIRENRHTK